mgnify:CR=1 FL=1
MIRRVGTAPARDKRPRLRPGVYALLPIGNRLLGTGEIELKASAASGLAPRYSLVDGPALVSLGKLNNVREAIAIARTARTILGASGITGEYPVMRHANNLESVLTYEGTSEMHTLMIGQALTGIAAFR